MGSLEELDKKLSKYKKKKQLDKSLENESTSTFAVAEIFAGSLVGFGLGYFLDYVFDTRPIFIIICFVLGVLSGFRNIYKFMCKKEK